MPDDAAALTQLLADTALAGREVHSFELPRCGEIVHAVRLNPDRVLAEWAIARALLDQTGRWPAAVTSWAPAVDVLTARTFLMDQSDDRPAPAVISQQAARLTGAEALAAIRAEQWAEPLTEDMVDWHLSVTQARCGASPDVAAAMSSGATERELDRWLFDWEEERLPTVRPEHASDDDWFLPSAEEDCCLLFLPRPVTAEALAYLEFYAEEGVAGASAERLVAVLASWQQRFGAELVAHWGTMLQFTVARPPNTLEQAWDLAGELDLIAPCTNALPGIVLRDSARTLWRRETWFLHERP